MIGDFVVLGVLVVGGSEGGQHEVDNVEAVLGGNPVGLDSLSADLAVLGHVRVVNFGQEFDLRCLEGELTEVEFHYELAASELLIAIDNHLPLEHIGVVKVPNSDAGVGLGLNVSEFLQLTIVSELKISYLVDSTCLLHL